MEMEWISVKDRLPEPGEIVLVHQIYSWQRFEDGVAVTAEMKCRWIKSKKGSDE